MFELKLGKNDVKGLLSPGGIFHLMTDADDLSKPFVPSAGQLVALKFETGPSKEIRLGSADSVSLGLSARTGASVQLLWPSSSADQLKLLGPFGMADYFDQGAHADRLLVLLSIGASADTSAVSDFKYTALTAGVTLKAGSDAGYGYLRPAARHSPAEQVLRDFFKEVKLPAGIDAAPQPGEVVVLEYGGYLSFGGQVGLGYQVSGSPSQQLKDLSISENIGLSFLGKLDFLSKVAGRFRIEVRQGKKPGWAAVKVCKSRDKNFQIAADVALGGKLSIEGFPDSADEFLETVVGLKARNWLNLFDKIRNYTDFHQLETYLDGLAKTYIEQLTGRAFSQLADCDILNRIITTFNKAIDSYRNVGDYAVALFDRYYDPVAKKVDDKIVQILEKITSLVSLDRLKGTILGRDITDILYFLTDGRPLDWLLGKIEINGEAVGSLEEIKQRAEDILSLIKEKAHQELREVIALAKSKFPLDQFLSNLREIDLNRLKTSTDQKLIGFVERLVGKSIKGISDSELGKVVAEVNDIVKGVDGFKNRLYEKVKSSLNQSLAVNLSLGYSRSMEQDALIDVELNLLQPEGRNLMKAVGSGDFSRVLQEYDPDVVRLNSGVLTHQVTRQSSVAFNIVGWHEEFKYRSVTKLVTRSEQHIKSEENGLITVTTDISLDTGTDKTKNGERIYTNLLLGFVGASKGAVCYDPDTQRYLVNAVTRVTGKYSLLIEDQETTASELENYLGYAVDFGIRPTRQEAVQALMPLLPKSSEDGFGRTSLDYEVRFSEAGLHSLFKNDISRIPMRRIIRELTLGHLLNSKKKQLIEIGWSYWTPAVYRLWHQSPPAFTAGPREFSPLEPSPVEHIAAPGRAVLQPWQLKVLDKLYFIEEALVQGFGDLQNLVDNRAGLSPLKYEEALAQLGKALNAYDEVDECDNTFFALFDALISSSGEPAVRDSSLTLKSRLPGQAEVTKMLTP